MRLYSKHELAQEIKRIAQAGWHRSVKETVDTRNDGAVGNTLEHLLGIPENNLPIPNAAEWELKGQREGTSSLITLKHMEPSPRAARIVANVLLPRYGWRHAQAGDKYPPAELSFRSTTSATAFTNRGFRICVDRTARKVRLVFDATKADHDDPEIVRWLQSVEDRGGLHGLDPEPYWGFDDLRYNIGSKIRNCFYVIAASRTVDRREYFEYRHLYVLSGFSFDKFLSCIETGAVLVDFDARTGHNHGTKFRLKQGAWPQLYNTVHQEF